MSATSATPEDASDHIAVNRTHWDDHAAEWVGPGERRWAASPRWGIWDIPNEELPLLPEDLSGMSLVELGCGTGYVSGWAVRRGASATGIDNSAAQLATARRLAAEHDVAIDLIHGDAEQVPLEDASADFAISEYGAAIWCDPHRWIPEAWRLLRPGGALVFLGTHHLAHVTAPLDGSLPLERTLHRPWFGLRRLDWTDAVDEPGGIEFSLPTAEWMALFRQVGFTVEDYAEPRCPEDFPEAQSFGITAEWARSWPSEQVWWLRKPRA